MKKTFIDFFIAAKGKQIKDKNGRTLSKATAYWLLQEEPYTELSFVSKPGWTNGELTDISEYEKWLGRVKLV